MITVFKRTKADNRIRLGYSIAFLLLVFAYGITFYANRELLKQSGKVAETNKVIANMEVMLSELKDAERYVRGYVITKQPAFLSPYIGSGKKADSLFHVVLRLTINNTEQQHRLIQLKKEIDQRESVFLASIQIFDNNNRQVSDSLAQLQLQSGKITDGIRQSVVTLQNEENRQLAVRDEKLGKIFSSVTLITLISVAIAFVLIIFGFVTYKREDKVRTAGAKEIEEYQEQLKKRIDELHTANIALMQMKRQEKFAATGRIARTIAHEVRNPLTNINLAMDQLKSEVVVKQDETSVMLFDMVKRNSARINQLISDLLNSTKFTELRYNKVSINDLLDEALVEANDRIALTNVEVVKKYSTDICEVAVDKGKIKIAFLNIIINAIEAMENKTGSVLTLETKGEANKCKVMIQDNGSGLDSESANKLFEPFFTNKPNGNGLGLTNTQNIILNHKGEISVETAKGKGTCFTIILSFPD
mgnify:CR=1 FL=1